jgi:hypothetical protein
MLLVRRRLDCVLVMVFPSWKFDWRRLSFWRLMTLG